MNIANLKVDIVKKRNIVYFIIFWGFLSIAPFIIISQYNHPSSDDFGLGLKQENLKTEIVKAYHKRNGRYFQTIIARSNPLRYHSFQLYKILPIIILSLYIIALFTLIYHFLHKYYSLKHITAISFLLFFLFILQMASPAEGVFWFSGYITYTVPTILTFFLIPVLLQVISTCSSFVKIILAIISFVFIIAIIGSSEISLLLVNSVLIFIYFNHLITTKKSDRKLLLLVILSLMLSFIEISAPSNHQRFTTYEYSKNFTWSLFGSLFLTIFSFIRWGLPVLIVSFFYSIYWGLPLANKIVNEKIKIMINHRLSLIFFLGFIYLSNFIFIWSTGSSPLAAKRVLNVIYLNFILGWFLNLQLFLNNNYDLLKKMPNNISDLLVILSLILLCLLPFNLHNNISTAYIDLISGKAKRYNNELMNRYQLINSCEKDTCEIPPLSEIPNTIFFRDIKNKEYSDYNNKLYSKYFGKKYIYLEHKNPEIKSNQITLKEFEKRERKKLVNFLKINNRN